MAYAALCHFSWPFLSVWGQNCPHYLHCPFPDALRWFASRGLLDSVASSSLGSPLGSRLGWKLLGSLGHFGHLARCFTLPPSSEAQCLVPLGVSRCVSCCVGRCQASLYVSSRHALPSGLSFQEDLWSALALLRELSFSGGLNTLIRSCCLKWVLACRI